MFLLISPYWLSVTLHNFICRICYLENASLQRGVPFMCMCVLPSMCMCVHAPQRATVDLHKTAPGKLHNTFGMCCTLLQWLSSSIHQHHGAVSLLSKPPLLSSISCSTILTYPTLSPSYSFFIYSCHPCLYTSPPRISYIWSFLSSSKFYYSASPQFNITLPWRPAAALRKHHTRNEFHCINICIMHKAQC